MMALRVGYTLDWVASEIGVSPRTIRSWIEKGLLRGGPAKGSRDGYSYQFVDQAMVIHEWLQLYPRGPLENLRDMLYPEPDEEDVA